MTNRMKVNVKKVIWLLCLCLLVTGCGILRRPQDDDKESKDKKEDPPKALTEMESITDGLIMDIEKVREQRALQQREQKQPSLEEEPPESENGQQESPPPIPEVNWKVFEKNVESLHAKWNSFETRVKEQGISEDTIQGFEDQLITLTEQIIARNEDTALLAANKVYSYYPQFFNVYMHRQPPEIKEMKYLIRQVLLYGRQDQWKEANDLLPHIKETWETAKGRMDKPDKNLNSKIDSAIHDFSYVVKQEKINLAQLKGNILMSNLEQVE